MQTWHIHIQGQVQGVGFRPFVYKQAQQFKLRGWVNNAIDGVHCQFNAEEEVALTFYKSLVDKAPVLSNITSHELRKLPPKTYHTFQIVHSKAEGKANLLLTPDFAICNDCRDELFAERNRRRGYPFITCTNCGPRYSIIDKLPYDRETTTMGKYGMCERCRKEYEDPLDRRYYSQTNSCETCGISMTLYDADQNILCSEANEIIDQITDLWNDGKIVAIKGIGGYLLTCDATNKDAIKMLRKRKQRPAKPFALMYPDVEALERDVHISEKEKAALTGSVSPITISAVKEKPQSGIRIPQIAPGLSRLGVMIPYTPLYALLLQSFGQPIIATSGNITNSPIIYKDKKALDELSHIADFVLTNDREIVVPQDDSVVTFSPTHGQKIIYRRSRGMAPTYINADAGSRMPGDTILATGAALKSTFTYLHQKNIFISQYLGDLDHFDTEQNYRHTVDHFIELFDERPDIILADKHPDYFSTRFAEQLADELNVAIKKHQHHQAHFAAVLGEHALLHSKESILGVIWDGTGLGDDGQIWGGEFFSYQNYTFSRCAHFNYFDFIAGDKMPREPRISALATSHGLEGAEKILKEKFTELEWKNYHRLLQKKSNLQTSSVGRLFDAVSSLLGLMDCSSYEGQAAMLLEEKSRKYVNQNGLSGLENYSSGAEKKSTQLMLQEIVYDLEEGIPKEMIAAKFHYSLVMIIREMANEQHAEKIAFSGGVFQNALLVDMIIEKLGHRHTLYFHKKLSPNDENISFGQLMCYLAELRNK
jgi:hydrogenase maturation protein HypF